MSLSTGDRVLVTGAASGLGLALVTQLIGRRCRVLATDVHDDEPTALSVLGDAVTYQRLDVRSDDDWSRALAWVQETWRGIDLVVEPALAEVRDEAIDAAGFVPALLVAAIAAVIVNRALTARTPILLTHSARTVHALTGSHAR